MSQQSGGEGRYVESDVHDEQAKGLSVQVDDSFKTVKGTLEHSRQPTNIRRATLDPESRFGMPGKEDKDDAEGQEEYLKSLKSEVEKALKAIQIRSEELSKQGPPTECRLCSQEQKSCDHAKPDSVSCVPKISIFGPDDEPPPPVSQDYSGTDQVATLTQPSPEVRFGQDPAKKCLNCFQKGYRCDGKSPCGTCSEKGVAICRPQGSYLSSIASANHCWPCRRQNLECNGAIPCDICLKERHLCYKHEPGRRCMACEAHGYFCDGASPCNTCVETGMSACKRETEDGFIERHYDISSKNNVVSKDCLRCLHDSTQIVGSLKSRCDRKRPCGNCAGEAEESGCCYQVKPDLKLWISVRRRIPKRKKNKVIGYGDVDAGEETSDSDEEESITDEYDDDEEFGL